MPDSATLKSCRSISVNKVSYRKEKLSVYKHCNIEAMYKVFWGGAVAEWLANWTLDHTGGVQALAAVIVLCSWARHFTLTVSLNSTQVYKWVPAK